MAEKDAVDSDDFEHEPYGWCYLYLNDDEEKEVVVKGNGNVPESYVIYDCYSFKPDKDGESKDKDNQSQAEDDTDKTVDDRGNSGDWNDPDINAISWEAPRDKNDMI